MEIKNLKYFPIITVCCSALMLSSNLFSHETFSSRTDSHAPIGVMGDHTHKTGEFMTSYRFSQMIMDGLIENDESISTDKYFEKESYMVAPLDMKMDMHMLGLMYAPTDNVTLMAMLSYMEMEMDHKMRMMTPNGAVFRKFRTESKGLGDVKLSGLINLMKTEDQLMVATVGFSLPTGTIIADDDTPMLKNAQLPLPMQLGSGTYGLLTGLTYAKYMDLISLGSQLSTTVNIGRNSSGYRKGNVGKLASWVAANVTPNMSTSLRLTVDHSGEYEGRDRALNPNMVPTADVKNQGRTTVTPSVGVNVKLHYGHRLAYEYGMPVYEKVNGIQLKNKSTNTLGWQWAF